MCYFSIGFFLVSGALSKHGCCIKPVLIDWKDLLYSQGNQGGLRITTAQTGVEHRVVQAKKGWVRDPFFILSLSTAVVLSTVMQRSTWALLSLGRNQHEKKQRVQTEEVVSA